MGPSDVPVGGKLWLFVSSHQFHTTCLILTSITVSENVGHDKVFGVVVEAVDLECQSLYPVVAGKGELEGVGALRREAGGAITFTDEICQDISLSVDVGGIDKGLGIAQSDAPLGTL